MDFEAILVIVFRWIHVISACLLLGGVFFARVILPAGLRQIADESTRDEAYAKCLRGLKLIVHPTLVLFLGTGLFNFFRLIPQYRLNPAMMHGLFGMHFLLGLVVFGLLIWGLAGKKPKTALPGILMTALLLLVLSVGIASTLKWARERAVSQNAVPTSADQIDTSRISQ